MVYRIIFSMVFIIMVDITETAIIIMGIENSVMDIIIITIIVTTMVIVIVQKRVNMDIIEAGLLIKGQINTETVIVTIIETM